VRVPRKGGLKKLLHDQRASGQSRAG
jgi:hypothetical protein